MFDFVSDGLRSALSLIDGAKRDIQRHSQIDEHLHEAVTALHRTADSVDRQVEVLEGLAASLPALTAALAKLTEQLGDVLHLAAPLEAVERDATGLLGHVFRRHSHDEASAPESS